MSKTMFAVFAVALLAAPGASFGAGKAAKPADKVAAKDAKDAKAAEAKPADPKAKPAEAKKPVTYQEIKKFGLKFEGPKVEFSSIGEQEMVQGAGLTFSIGVAGEYAAKTFEDAKAAKLDYSPTKVVKEEKLADGWNIQFVNRGGMGNNHFVWIRRTIGGKSYQCESTSSNAEQALAAEKACLSLTKQ